MPRFWSKMQRLAAVLMLCERWFARAAVMHAWIIGTWGSCNVFWPCWYRSIIVHIVPLWNILWLDRFQTESGHRFACSQCTHVICVRWYPISYTFRKSFNVIKSLIWSCCMFKMIFYIPSFIPTWYLHCDSLRFAIAGASTATFCMSCPTGSISSDPGTCHATLWGYEPHLLFQLKPCLAILTFESLNPSVSMSWTLKDTINILLQQ
jgi:hypothetical protein